MADINCRCEGKGWYWRTPDGFNPFLAGGFNTAKAMFKATCSCDPSEMTPAPCGIDISPPSPDAPTTATYGRTDENPYL